ncbi:MAG: hypothetical protein AAFO62_09420, partial [Pseudomonadota bacterium]
MTVRFVPRNCVELRRNRSAFVGNGIRRERADGPDRHAAHTRIVMAEVLLDERGQLRIARMAVRGDVDDPPLRELLQLDDAAFRAKFAGTPVKRTGHACFLRNVLIAAGNAGDPELAPLIEQHLSHDDPRVRG